MIYQRLALGILIAVVLVSGVAGVTQEGRAATKALLFIPQIIPGSPINPQEWLLGQPTKQVVSFPINDGVGTGDLYIPASDSLQPAVVLFLGVLPADRDDPRIVNLATGLARSNMVVLIPWSEVMLTSRRLDLGAVELLIGAFQYLENHPSVDSMRIGMGGFCVGASFAALAAQDNRIRSKVAYVNLFGGYYDARNLMVSIASRTSLQGDTVEPWEPREDTQEVFAIHIIESVLDIAEQQVLRRAFSRDGSPEEVNLPFLSRHGRAVYKLLSGVTRDEAKALLGLFPPDFLATLERLSPSTLIGDLEAPVLIMHDREDSAVPAAESRRMAKALEQDGNVFYTEFSLFQHMDPIRPLAPPNMAQELWKLLVHMYKVMRLGA